MTYSGFNGESRKGKTAFIAFAIIIFLAGGLGGIFVDRAFFHNGPAKNIPRAKSANIPRAPINVEDKQAQYPQNDNFTPQFPRRRFFAATPGERYDLLENMLLERLKQRLALTPDQEAAFRKILDKNRGEFDKTRMRIRNEILGLQNKVASQAMPILNRDQQTEFKKMLERVWNENARVNPGPENGAQKAK
jgi:hypothetical protein